MSILFIALSQNILILTNKTTAIVDIVVVIISEFCPYLYREHVLMPLEEYCIIYLEIMVYDFENSVQFV